MRPRGRDGARPGRDSTGGSGRRRADSSARLANAQAAKGAPRPAAATHGDGNPEPDAQEDLEALAHGCPLGLPGLEAQVLPRHRPPGRREGAEQRRANCKPCESADPLVLFNSRDNCPGGSTLHSPHGCPLDPQHHALSLVLAASKRGFIVARSPTNPAPENCSLQARACATVSTAAVSQPRGSSAFRTAPLLVEACASLRLGIATKPIRSAGAEMDIQKRGNKLCACAYERVPSTDTSSPRVVRSTALSFLPAPIVSSCFRSRLCWALTLHAFKSFSDNFRSPTLHETNR